MLRPGVEHEIFLSGAVLPRVNSFSIPRFHHQLIPREYGQVVMGSRPILDKVIVYLRNHSITLRRATWKKILTGNSVKLELQLLQKLPLQ